MPKDPDNFKEKWESLTEQERQFVLVADEFDRRLPHRAAPEAYADTGGATMDA